MSVFLQCTDRWASYRASAMDCVTMETSTDADLARHPLRPDDTTVAQEDGTPAHTDAGPTHWGEKEGEDPFGFSGCDEDDIPCTQELDPRPLAGGERRGGGGGGEEWVPKHI